MKSPIIEIFSVIINGISIRNIACKKGIWLKIERKIEDKITTGCTTILCIKSFDKRIVLSFTGEDLISHKFLPSSEMEDAVIVEVQVKNDNTRADSPRMSSLAEFFVESSLKAGPRLRLAINIENTIIITGPMAVLII